MAYRFNSMLIEQQRDAIKDWLEEEAPYADVDQKHLDANTPERAYWHLGYQAALNDVIELLSADAMRGSEGTPN